MSTFIRIHLSSSRSARDTQTLALLAKPDELELELKPKVKRDKNSKNNNMKYLPRTGRKRKKIFGGKILDFGTEKNHSISIYLHVFPRAS